MKLYHGDRLGFLSELNDKQEKVDLALFSPLYGIGKSYEVRMNTFEYTQHLQETINGIYSVLADNGSLAIQVGHRIHGVGKRKRCEPIDYLVYPILDRLGMKMKNRIIWNFGHGMHDKYRFSGRHEVILWFTKGDDYTFNLDPVRIPSKYPNKRYHKGPKKGQISGNPLGKNPSDVWMIPNVKSNHVEKTDHPCQFPVGLAERIVLALTNEGDFVIDPYVGSGSTAIAAIRHNRLFAGSDTEIDYINQTRNRVKMEKRGSLRTRPMNKEIHKP